MASYHDRETIRRMMLFSGRSNPDLAKKIAEHLGLTLGEIELKTFSNGELYVRYDESIRGADVFLVQSGSRPVNRNLMELLIMVNAAKLASAKRITVVVPWYPYSRAGQEVGPREPISARLVADLLQVAGVDRVLTMDLHAGQVQGFFNIPVDHMTALPHVRAVLPRPGAAARSSSSSSRRRRPGQAGQEVRRDARRRPRVPHEGAPGHGESRVMTLIGDVNGKVAIIRDDIIDTAGTLCDAAQAVTDAGAERVFACATHGLFSRAGARPHRRFGARAGRGLRHDPGRSA